VNLILELIEKAESRSRRNKINIYIMSIKTSFRSNAVLEKNVSSYLDQYLIPVEEIWQPSDFTKF
jgi:hypothetical protein